MTHCEHKEFFSLCRVYKCMKLMQSTQDPNFLTQEEIDALCKEISDALDKNGEFKKMIDESGLDLDTHDTNCWHEWKSYQGFSEQYDYCNKCGVKR